MEFMELQHICQKKGVQKLSGGSERFFAYKFIDGVHGTATYLSEKRVQKLSEGSERFFAYKFIDGVHGTATYLSEKRSAKIKRGQRAVFCILQAWSALP